MGLLPKGSYWFSSWAIRFLEDPLLLIWRYSRFVNCPTGICHASTVPREQGLLIHHDLALLMR